MSLETYAFSYGYVDNLTRLKKRKH